MATITLYKDKINGVGSLLDDIIKSSNNLNAQLGTLKSTLQGVDSSTCNLQDTVDSISSSSKSESDKVEDLKRLNNKLTAFIEMTACRDSSAESEINKAKEDFYTKYSYLKPECEKSRMEKIADGMKKACEWCKEHWKEIVLAIELIAAVACLFIPGLQGIGVGILLGALKGAITGGLIGGITSLLSGGSFLEGFAQGALDGAIMGGALGGVGGIAGKFITCGSKLGNAIQTTAKVSGAMSNTMDGFDTLAMGLGMIDPDNPLTALNNKLHQSDLYNNFQMGVSLVSSFTGAASQNMACFIAGTTILTATGLVAIEKLAAGDKVISTNPDTLETAEKTVLETYVRQVNKLVHITINGEEIVTTDNHPFYVQDRGFINAGNLLVGDKLISVNGEDLTIEDYYIELTEEPVSVYNFQVEDFHTYFVGDFAVLVHNAEYGNGHYNNNPSDNPKVLADAVEDPNAVYGYRPNEDGSLKNFANEDWSNPEFVENAKQKRLQYIEDDKAIYDVIAEMKNNGCSTEEMARAACDYRNQTRLNSYLDSELVFIAKK